MVVTAALPSQFDDLIRLYNTLRTHDEVQLIVFDLNLTSSMLSAASQWHGVELRNSSSGPLLTLPRALASVARERGGLVLWLEPTAQVRSSLRNIWRSIAMRGFWSSAHSDSPFM